MPGSTPAPTPPQQPDPGANDAHAFVGNAIVTGSVTMGSRTLGLLRDLVLGRLLGDTGVASAFAAAFAIPNLFRRLFGEGALSAAFLPEYTRLADADRRHANALASLVLSLVVAATGLLTLLLIGVLFLLRTTLAPDADRNLFFDLAMLMAPFMPLVCASALLGGMLNAHGRFAQPAAAPILLNLCLIGGALVGVATAGRDARETIALLVGVGVLVAGVLQVLWGMWALRTTVSWTRQVSEGREAARRIGRRFVPALVGMGTLQLNSFLDTAIAMWPIWVGPMFFGLTYPLDESSNGVLFFAQRLYQLPLGVFGVAVGTAIFPALARAFPDGPAFVSLIRRGVRLAAYIGVPASVGLALVGPDLVRALFSGEGSAFSDAGVARASWIVVAYAGAIWAYSVNQVLTRAFNAAGDTATPMRVSLAMVGLNLTLNLTLIWWFREIGLALSTALSAIVQTGVLLALLPKHTGDERTLDRTTLRALGRTVLATLLMGLVVWGVASVMPAPTGWAESALRVGAMTLAGAATFFAASRLVRCEELAWLISSRRRNA